MTSKLSIPKISKGYNRMATMSFKDLVGQVISKNVKFMGQDVKISKLTVEQVLEIQEKAKAGQDDDAAGLELVKTVIKMAVAGAEELDDNDFKKFPMEELAKLSSEIMKYSGMATAETGK